ncbi:MAG: hypothetical protein IH991_02010 [Planctomycetes bacterium]|nr:hypothetical protein [Planctomycetota bacterium]
MKTITLHKCLAFIATLALIVTVSKVQGSGGPVTGEELKPLNGVSAAIRDKFARYLCFD